MANKYIASDYYVKINNVDLSNWGFNVDTNFQKDKIDVSGFSASGAKEYLPGQKDEEFVVSFRQDHSSNAVDQTLWPLYDSGSTFPFELRPTSGSVSATNPKWSGSANLYEYHPLNAALGAAAETQVTFSVFGGAVRGTA